MASQDLHAVFFLLGMLLVGLAMVMHGLRLRRRAEIVIGLGYAAVFLMFFLRLSLAERSHLIEYSVLAIFLHRALLERRPAPGSRWWPALWAFALCSLIGLVDEGMQYWLPGRIFDPVDLFFNSSAAALAIALGLALDAVRRRRNR